MPYKVLFSIGVSLLIISFSFACQSNSNNSPTFPNSDPKKENQPQNAPDYSNFSRAYFASGCFWCVEAIYESVIGVEEVFSGYSGGHTKNPTYELSNTGKTGHAEAVEVIYDPKKISFEQLVDVYFGSQNIEQVNGQGPDHGSQYRSILFYSSPEEKAIIEKKIAELTADGFKVAAEVQSFEKFWMGEEYHQNYERLHPNQGYIQQVSIPRLQKFQAKYPALLKKNH